MVDPTKISARQGNLKSFLKLMREKNKMKNSEPKVSGTEDENRSSNYLTGPNENPVSRSPVTSIDASNASTSREKNISKVHVICEASVGLQSSGYNIDASEEPTKEEMVTSKGLTNDELDSRRRKKEDRKSSKNSQSLISIRDGSGFSNDDSVRERKKRGRCRRRHSSHCQEIDEREYLNYEEYWDQRYRKESEQLKPYWEVLARSKRKEHATSSQTIEIYSECRRTEGERISFSTLKLSSTPDPRREERWRSWAPSSPPSNYEEYGKRPWINTSPQACEERKTRALLNSSRLLQGKKGRRRCSSSSPPSLEKDGGLLPICVSLSPSGGRRTSWINPSPPRGNSGRCRAGEGDLRSSDHNEKTGDEVHEEAENLQPSTSNEATASFSENATESSAVPQEPYTEEQKRLRQKFIDRILESWPKET